VTVDTWPAVALGDVLTLTLAPQPVEPQKSYPTLGVYGFGRGVITNKPAVNGHEIAASTLFRVEPGQFIYSKLKAFEGAFAVVPEEAAGRFVTNEFPTFSCRDDQLCAQYLGWLFRSRDTWEKVSSESTGIGARRERLHPTDLLKYRIPLPSMNKQREIAKRLEGLSARLKTRSDMAERQKSELTAMLDAAFKRISADAPRASLGEVAPLVKRTIAIDQNESYTEFGIRSFYRGIFQRRTLSGSEFSWQSLYRIEPGDLVFSNIMAWEKAIALVDKADANCVGNHRMLTCEPDRSRIVPGALFFYFTTRQGFAQIDAGSPGSIARNKTLSPDALQAIEVPVPSLDAQEWFEKLRTKVAAIRSHQAAIATDADALLPSMLNQIFG
jgi:type I restriction enzyme S subunit